MHRGYVKDWRKGLESPLFKHPLTWHFWTYCRLKATHKPLDLFINGVPVHLEPGQLLYGRKQASVDTGLSHQNLRTAIKHLKSTNQITVQSTTRFSIITICKWEDYQAAEYQPNQPDVQPLTKDQPSTNQAPTTNKNINNIKNIEEEGIAPQPLAPLINSFKTVLEEKHNHVELDIKWTRKAQNDLNKMIRKGYDRERIARAIEWYRDNEYWQIIDDFTKLHKHILEIESKMKDTINGAEFIPLPRWSDE